MAYAFQSPMTWVIEGAWCSHFTKVRMSSSLVAWSMTTYRLASSPAI